MNSSSNSLQVAQVALCTSDLPGSLRLYTSALGFVSGGGSAMWGSPMRLQGLSEDARAVMWWLVGRQEYFQLEMFSHTHPFQRPLPVDWRASDVGWVRIGVVVPDLQECMRKLQACGVTDLIAPRTYRGVESTCFRDPYAGCFVEVIQDGPAIPGGPRRQHFDVGAAILYATSCVTDLPRARDFYINTVGLREEPLDVLHIAEHESLWGLAGANRDGFVARAGDIYLEIVRYASPAPRPLRTDHRSSDQGIMNVALGTRNFDELQSVVKRVTEKGYASTIPLGAGPIGATYVTDPEQLVELVVVPAEFDAMFGFAPAHPLIGNHSPV